MLALQGLAARTVGRVRRGLGIAGTKIESGARSSVATTRETVDAARESWRAMNARRRAVSERHTAHARYVAHLEEVTDSPEPYPLPPPLHELEEHEERVRQQIEQREIAAAQSVAAGPRPTRLPDSVPGFGPDPSPAGGMGAGAGIGTALRERVVRPATTRTPRAVLPAPPLATRVRSAVMLVVLMSALGAVVTAVILGALFLVVNALSNV